MSPGLLLAGWVTLGKLPHHSGTWFSYHWIDRLLEFASPCQPLYSVAPEYFFMQTPTLIFSVEILWLIYFSPTAGSSSLRPRVISFLFLIMRC